MLPAGGLYVAMYISAQRAQAIRFALATQTLKRAKHILDVGCE
jgi:cyclopropane fatty-acyl-phospholipid synthase-like methyltransferase